MSKEFKHARKKIRKHLDTWLQTLGLRWWNTNIYYHTDKKDIRHYFKSKKGGVVRARVYSDWRYGTATIHFNIPAFIHVSADEIERTVIHELIHVLVNEMREDGIDHEERVVTGLTKAFIWTRDYSEATDA